MGEALVLMGGLKKIVGGGWGHPPRPPLPLWETLLRYNCIKLFSRLSFKNPGEIRHNPKSVRDL